MVTALIVTSPHTRGSSTEMIEEVIVSLPLVKNIIIVADNYKIGEQQLKSGKITQEEAVAYESYLIKLAALALKNRWTLIRRKNRSGFADNVKTGLSLVKTEFVLVCQHDIRFNHSIDLEYLTSINCDYITFQCRTLDNIVCRMASLKLPSLPGFQAIDFWYDKNHLVRTDFYKRLFQTEIISNFIEDSWGQEIKKRIKGNKGEFDKCRMYAMLGRNFLTHLNGRKMFNLLKRYPRKAIWRNLDFDQEIIVTGCLGKVNNVKYYSIKGSATGIPGNQIVWKK